MVAGMMIYNPAEAKARPREGGIGSCDLAALSAVCLHGVHHHSLAHLELCSGDCSC